MAGDSSWERRVRRGQEIVERVWQRRKKEKETKKNKTSELWFEV